MELDGQLSTGDTHEHVCDGNHYIVIGTSMAYSTPTVPPKKRRLEQNALSEASRTGEGTYPNRQTCLLRPRGSMRSSFASNNSLSPTDTASSVTQ
eukprot:7748148-Lingulodinium_polyedra.AAC.1